MTGRVPLSVLDLSPVVSGGTVGEALRSTVDLARHAEAAGYGRYWLAEHHFTPGVASSVPSLLIAQVAAATTTIRVGSAAVQTGHQTPLAVVEQFGLLDALHPGRIDLGLGRSGQARTELVDELAAHRAERPERPAPSPRREARVVDGVLLPAPFSYAKLAGSKRLRYLYEHLQQPGARTPEYADQLDEVLDLIAGTRATPDGDPVTAVPGTGADLDVWVFGSTAGASARAAGERGLPFTANYHITPGSVLDAVDAYRDAFVPSTVLAEPYVAVSADVVVAEDAATARRLASPYGVWVRSIRTALSAIPFPTPEEADRHAWTDEDRELVADRVDTQLVGDPAEVVERLEALAALTRADELVVTSITHDHGARVRSHQLLADAWFDGPPPVAPRVGRLALREAVAR